ncbi:MAG: DNA adenine methylase, partial [Armatimonadota bacterium]
GIFGSSWGYTVSSSGQGMASSCSRWMTAFHMLPAIHERLMRVQVEHSDFRGVIKRFDTPETLFYCDPPYIPETRKSGGYRHEMTAEDHQELVEILLSIQGKVVLSGYNHPIYGPLEAAGWTRTDFQTSCAAAGRTRATGIQGAGAALRMQPRTESVWVNASNKSETLLTK